MRMIALGLAAWVLTGCAAGGDVVENPRTGARATCQRMWNGLDPWAQTDACLGGYEALGWVRVKTP